MMRRGGEYFKNFLRILEITHFAEQAVSGLIRAILTFWALAAKEQAVRPCGKWAGVWRTTLSLPRVVDGKKEDVTYCA
jgi:hypothetical protein